MSAAKKTKRKPPHTAKTEQEKQEELVGSMYGHGLTQDQICDIMGISSRRVLARKFGKALEKGKALADAAVMKTLHQMATSGMHPAATFFYLKCRCRWREVPPDAEAELPPVSPKIGYTLPKGAASDVVP